MYTFYFQALEDLDQWKLIAYRGPENFDIIELGETYDNLDLSDLLDMGCRVVQYPLFDYDYGLPVQTTRMFYAKGYRGPDTKPEPSGHVVDPEYLKFVNYGNGQEQILSDWCSEDIGQGLNRESVPDEAAKSDPIAQNANNQSTPTPRIGPLPPQASLAPLGDNPELVPSGHVYGMWHSKVEVPKKPTWEEMNAYSELRLLQTGPVHVVPADEYLQWKEAQALEEANSKLSKPLTAPDAPSWWAMIKNWFKTDF